MPNRSAKGSHTVWEHPSGMGRVTVAGKDGNDAQFYLERMRDGEIARLGAGRK